MKANSDKNHLRLGCRGPSAAVIDGPSIKSNVKEVMLEKTVDKDLKFNDHVKNLCKKASQMLLLVFHHSWTLIRGE